MGTKRIVLLAAGMVLAAAGGFFGWYWWTSLEDVGRVDPIPEPAGTRPPLTTGPHDWPRWGNATCDHKSSVTGIRTDWSGGLTKRWSVYYLCQGSRASTWSAPVVRGNRLVVLGRDKTRDLVFCLHAETGELLWMQSYESEAGSGHGPGPRATPTIDGDRVYTFGRSGDLACWQLYDGKEVWRRSVKTDGGTEPQWGFASSPLVHAGRVIVQAGGSAGIVAYDKATGAVAWTSPVGDAGYAAVRTISVGGGTQLLAFHAKALSGLNPADGKELWSVPWVTEYGVNAATPAVSGEVAFLSSDYGKGCAAVKVAPDSADVLWRNEVVQSHHSDAVILDGYVYSYSGKSDNNRRGELKCVELATGAEQWSTREVGQGTLLYVDGYLLCLDIKGNLFLVRPSPRAFEQVASLPAAIPDVGKQSWTMPVVAGGNLYLRYRQTLICYQLTK